MTSLDLNKIIQHPFPDNQYIKEEHPKKQIYLHHTAGRSNGINTYRSWESNTERVGTCVVISGVTDTMPDGQIVQGFSSKNWAYHLGLTKDVFKKFGLSYQSLDKISIGIEICNWGILKKTDRGFESWAQVIIPEKDVCVLDKSFKGSKYYHNYTDAQIESVRQLLVYWSERYNIPLTYNEDIFDLNKRALSGEPGVYTHNSVRKDKTDIYPHPKIIKMLQSL
jgi:N-acetyl-anhydromuramyl-L-alanine amidase AmpD